MNSKNIIWLVVVLVIIGLALFFAVGQESPNEPDTETKDVRLIEPEAGSIVSSPLTVRGEAPGNWFFEDNIPVKLLGEDGEVLAQAGFQSVTGEWMTTDQVLFEGALEFDAGGNESGTLVISKDNPSGLSEHDDSVSFTVKFGGNSSQAATSFKVFFSSNDSDHCEQVTGLVRTVPKTQAVARASLEKLLEGPTSKETFEVSTNIPSGVTLNSLRIENGTAYADFSEELDEGVAGSCRVLGIRAQIEETLKQFSTVNEVVISINGRTEDVLQP